MSSPSKKAPATPGINDLPVRVAMGLPDRYLAGNREGLESAARALATSDPCTLAVIAEDPSRPFAERHAAGLLLGLIGDPRIDPTRPAMRAVPSGSYAIGIDESAVDLLLLEFGPNGVQRDWLEKEVPRHAIAVPAYWIARYPVTNLEYEAFLLETGHLPLPTHWALGVLPAGRGNHPVHGVSPTCADAYACWLAKKTGRPFRLPTEAEWEIAASAGNGRVYPWGNAFSTDCANTREGGLLSTTPIGVYPAGLTPFGCLDMSGNVEEYAADAYAAYPGGRLVRDDLFRQDPTYRIARGGSFSLYRDLARCSRRHGFYPSPLYAIGFRLAETHDSGES